MSTVSLCGRHYNMNQFEARLKIHSAIRDALVSLGADEGSTEEEILSLEDECSEIADILLEEIGLDVVSVEGEIIHATIALYEPE